MSSGATQAERLAVLEERISALIRAQEVMHADVKALGVDLQADKAALAALTNRGAGLLIGAALAGGAAGAGLVKAAQALIGHGA